MIYVFKHFLRGKLEGQLEVEGESKEDAVTKLSELDGVFLFVEEKEN